MAAASSSASFFEIRDQEDHQNNQIQQQSLTPSSSAATANGSQPAAAPQKKKRNLPGNPNPDAEVIALSPKTLLATNRFVCEVCNKGFQREQNLQLHRRGHNLPWKLRQKSTKEVRRKVYLCPELTCVHHDPSRALGDLTGIKKHFCRKHGEKKWKCDKCSKRYAVQSDWKAHSKTCGTREYRCDCGTLFSRRDSFITHRAFCDALTQESARLPAGLNTVGLFTNSNMDLGLSQVNPQLSSLQGPGRSSADLLRLGGSGGSSQFDHLIPQSNHNSSFDRSPSSAFYLAGASSNHDFQEDPTKPFHGLMQLQNLQNNTAAASSTAANLFNLSFFSNSGGSTSTITNSSNTNSQNAGFLIGSDQFNNASAGAEQMSLFAGNLMGDHGGVSSLYNASVHNETVLPHMSATALLQKAAQMGATTSGGGGGGGGGGGSSLLRGFAGISKTESMRSQMENEANLQDLMNSLANGSAGIFGGSAGGGNEVGGGFDGFNHDLTEMGDSKLHRNLSIGGGSDGLTRDFLGVGSVMRGLGGGLSQREQHQMGSLNAKLRSGSSGGRPFGGGSLQ